MNIPKDGESLSLFPRRILDVESAIKECVYAQMVLRFTENESNKGDAVTRMLNFSRLTIQEFINPQNDSLVIDWKLWRGDWIEPGVCYSFKPCHYSTEIFMYDVGAGDLVVESDYPIFPRDNRIANLQGPTMTSYDELDSPYKQIFEVSHVLGMATLRTISDPPT